ncbi:suppressor of fused domain protein [Paenibacillus sp. E222]|uniref:suppressor of fused domain protein n=1 Tax=Paenibacillus sp. E222 TaxID=2748863 RepID=UPI0015C5DFFD|nr:suppressor of fused domain protein [Paenibacillus sp. E222]QLG37109.1 suppressor of fused domain protein [Paenibacillus sp. E222]
MKIWRMSEVTDGQILDVVKDGGMLEELNKGISLINEWKVIQMRLKYEGDSTQIYSISSHLSDMILNQHAAIELREFLENNVEVLPVIYKNETHYVMNVLNILDCINLDKSIANKYGGFEKLEFIEERVSGQHIFKTIFYNYEITEHPIISSATYVSDEFKQRVEEAGLEGFDFDLAWSSEPEAYVERNPRIRVTDRQDAETHISTFYGPIHNMIPAESNDAGDPEIYITEPTAAVPYQTLVSFGNSYFRGMTPASLDTGYAEIVMHLPVDAQLTKENWENRPLGWVVPMMRHFVKEIMQRGYFTGQWLVFPNQSEEDLADTYREMFSETGVPAHTKILPYDDSTTYCGVMIVPPLPQCPEALNMPYRDEGKEMEGEWPIYFHTLLPLYREEIIHFFEKGRDSLITKLMANGVEAVYQWDRQNSCL